MRGQILLFMLLLSNICLVFTQNKFLRDEFNINNNSLEKERDPDEHRSIDEEIVAKNYNLEIYFVITDDDYILKVYRIVGYKGEEVREDSKKQTVLLQHGLADSSDSWVSNSEDLSLAYQLVRKGYDVWLGNNRGNKHSLSHKTLIHKDKKFWDFSFHEMGLHDLKSTISFIIEKTKHDKITYIGHSQGCSQFFALCSLQPEFCSGYVKAIVALAPATFLDNGSSNILTAMAYSRLDIILSKLGFNVILESQEGVNKFDKLVCELVPSLCNLFDQLIADMNVKDNNQDRLEVFYAHFPSGVGIKTISQFGKIIRQKRFMRLDNDEDYPVDKINVPMYLFIGKNDKLADVTDSRRFKALLNPEYVKLYEEYDNMGHLTFLMTNGKNSFTQDVLNTVDEINK